MLTSKKQIAAIYISDSGMEDIYEISTIRRQSCIKTGGVVDGKEVTMQVKPGDKVIYSKYAGTEVKLDDEEYIVVKQNDILAVIED